MRLACYACFSPPPAARKSRPQPRSLQPQPTPPPSKPPQLPAPKRLPAPPACALPAFRPPPPSQPPPPQPPPLTASPSLSALSLTEAIGRSQSANTAYAQALAESKIAEAQTGIARSALLPGVVYHNQFLYTQPQRVNGKPAIAGAGSPLFIANNAVHEYISQVTSTETLSAALLTDLRRTEADAAVARARLEVARRGLVASVVVGWFSALADQAKVATAQQALDEAIHFTTLSKQLESGGEVAHADVIKANLQVQQRQRDLADAALAAEKSRIDLAVLLFPNPLTPYTLAGSLTEPTTLPPREAINAAAGTDNPDVKAALAAFRASSLELTSAKFDYLPTLALNVSYGIDATQFAITSSDGSHNLGYSAYATLDIPVWDWFATRDRVRQAAARKDLAQTELTSTQRQLAASIEELYAEARVAHDALQSLDISVADATQALHLSELRYAGR